MKKETHKPYYIFGIRHHGAGCAYHLMHALETYQPDCILIECPEEAQTLISQTPPDSVSLPAAILLFDDGNTNSTQILPFADFSPEWVAIRHGHQYGVPIRAIDLPLGLRILDKSLPFARLITPAMTGEIKDTGSAFEFLAAKQGIDDVDLWWEINFESQTADIDQFEKIHDFVIQLLPFIENGTTLDNKTREAWMRRHLRKAIKEGFQKIAVICGAAHAPYLDQLNHFAIKDDQVLCKNTAGKWMKACWIPWSYKKLSSRSGYSAGVTFPNFYEHLFNYRDMAPTTIVSELSINLRKKGFDISPAHTLETVNLAKVLSNLRGYDIPGIQILREAAHAVFNLEDHNFTPALIEECFIGDKIGEVPIDIINQALISDFYDIIKSLRYNKYIKTTTQVELTLDLREDKQHIASIFLWRLILLGIPWGTPATPFQNTKGTFNEYWYLEWKDEYLIFLFYQTMYGNTIESAALEKTRENLIQDTSPTNLLSLLKPIINAEISPLIDLYLDIINNSILEPLLTGQWLDLLPELLSIHRYGSVRKLDLKNIELIISDLFVKTFINFELIVHQMSTEETDQYLSKLKLIQGAIKLSELKDVKNFWYEALKKIGSNHLTPALLRGWIYALCLEQQLVTKEAVLSEMSYQLSDLDALEKSVAWIQGVMSIQVFSVFEIPSIIEIINDWLALIPHDRFKPLLPGLRKAFGHLNKNFKQGIIQYTKGQFSSSMDTETESILEEDYFIHLKKYLNWVEGMTGAPTDGKHS